MCYFVVIPYGGENHINKIPPKSREKFVYVLFSSFVFFGGASFAPYSVQTEVPQHLKSSPQNLLWDVVIYYAVFCPQTFLGGRFGYFLFVSPRGRGKRSPGRQGGRGVVFIEIPGGGGVSQRGARGARGREGVCGEFGGGGG